MTLTAEQYSKTNKHDIHNSPIQDEGHIKIIKRFSKGSDHAIQDNVWVFPVTFRLHIQHRSEERHLFILIHIHPLPRLECCVRLLISTHPFPCFCGRWLRRIWLYPWTPLHPWAASPRPGRWCTAWQARSPACKCASLWPSHCHQGLVMNLNSKKVFTIDSSFL